MHRHFKQVMSELEELPTYKSSKFTQHNSADDVGMTTKYGTASVQRDINLLWNHVLYKLPRLNRQYIGQLRLLEGK